MAENKPSRERVPGEDDDDSSPPAWMPGLLRLDREREARELALADVERQRLLGLGDGGEVSFLKALAVRWLLHLATDSELAAFEHEAKVMVQAAVRQALRRDDRRDRKRT